jgi:hypothetical protein
MHATPQLLPVPRCCNLTSNSQITCHFKRESRSTLRGTTLHKADTDTYRFRLIREHLRSCILGFSSSQFIRHPQQYNPTETHNI